MTTGFAIDLLVMFALVMFAINVALLRWIFRVNRVVKLLESIDLSLQYLPAVRDGRTAIAGRRAA